MGKQKINYVLILFCMGVLWNSCTKISKELTVVEFVILNPANGKPFANVPVRIDERRSTNKGVMAETIFEGQTDANGKCKFEFHAKKGSGHWYVPYIDESYFGLQGEGFDFSYLARPAINWDPIIKDQYNEARYEITFYAHYYLKIKNLHCEGSTDTLVYHAWTPDFPGGGGAYDYTTTRPGCVNFQFEDPARVYMGWQKVEWEARKSSGITYGKDSIYLEQGEIGTIEINY